jgi:hypothetical protein
LKPLALISTLFKPLTLTSTLFKPLALAVVRLYASAKMLGDPGLKSLGCPRGVEIYIQNEVRRERGCGVGTCPIQTNLKKF